MHCFIPPMTTVSRRSGLTRVEVFVVLFCFSLLVVLIVPLISNQRETQRAVACRARLGSLGGAFLRYADDRDDAFPVLEDGKIPWTIALLAYEGSERDADLLDQFSQLQTIDETLLHASRYLCPNGRDYPVGATSYVVNGGMGDFEVDSTTLDVTEPRPHSLEIDWDGNEVIGIMDLRQSHAAGMIWRPHEKIQSWTQAEVRNRDGLRQTILLSENQNAERWQSLKTFDLAFVVGRDRVEFGPVATPFEYRAVDLGPYGINFSRSGRAGSSPSPGTTHGNAVNVVFADGSAQAISEEIDPLLYLRLLTPSGTMFGESQVIQNESEPVEPSVEK